MTSMTIGYQPSLFEDAPLPTGPRSREKAEWLIADTEWLASWGMSFSEIAQRLGKTPQALSRALYRYGRNDLARLGKGVKS